VSGYREQGTGFWVLFAIFYSLIPIPYSLFPIPSSLFPVVSLNSLAVAGAQTTGR
jgi:hypothetical protein